MSVNLQNKKSSIFSILGGVVVSIAVTLILILLFALLIRFINISDKFIFPVNQIIKIVSIFIGTIILHKKNKSKGFLKGLLFGIIYFIICFVVFSILQGKFTFDMNNFYDMLLTSLMAGLIGIIVVNIGRR